MSSQLVQVVNPISQQCVALVSLSGFLSVSEVRRILKPAPTNEPPYQEVAGSFGQYLSMWVVVEVPWANCVLFAMTTNTY